MVTTTEAELCLDIIDGLLDIADMQQRHWTAATAELLNYRQAFAAQIDESMIRDARQRALWEGASK
jgi:hypothetical protein